MPSPLLPGVELESGALTTERSPQKHQNRKLHDGNGLFSATCPDLFQLDATSGEISVASALDRDVAPLKDLSGLCVITIQVRCI